MQQVALWFVLLPIWGSALLDRYLMPQGEMQTNGMKVVSLLSLYALAVVIFWGQACTLIIGKRLLQAKAGRTRTSFKAVRSQAQGIVIPLILTGILRAGMILLWSLLLILPGIIYAIRTVLYGVAMVMEGDAYRSALRGSIDKTQGKGWTVTWHLFCYGFILYIPVLAIMLPLSAAADAGTIPGWTADIGVAISSAVASVLYTLSLILLYGELQSSSHST